MTGKPVMIVYAEASGTVWSLYAAEKYMYAEDGTTVVHDFSLGPVLFDSSTGAFTVNNGENGK